MNSICACDITKQLKLEADVGADPIWCDLCGYNLELDLFEMPEELRRELEEWSSSYGEWFDWETDTLMEDGTALERKHNQLGEQLTAKLQVEFEDLYTVRFAPSTIAGKYNPSSL